MEPNLESSSIAFSPASKASSTNWKTEQESEFLNLMPIVLSRFLIKTPLPSQSRSSLTFSSAPLECANCLRVINVCFKKFVARDFSKLAEYYNKGDIDVKHKDPKQEFSNIPDNTIIVKVKRGSKIKNILGFVEKSFKDETNRHMIFTGCGDAIEKTITCAEITKTNFQGLHQISKLNALRVEEFWDPTNPDLDRLQVTREIPMLCILLCKDALDSNEHGYQGPKDSSRFPRRTHKRKNTGDHPPLEDKGTKETL